MRPSASALKNAAEGLDIYFGIPAASETLRVDDIAKPWERLSTPLRQIVDLNLTAISICVNFTNEFLRDVCDKLCALCG
jgi:hypothetical protein